MLSCCAVLRSSVICCTSSSLCCAVLSRLFCALLSVSSVVLFRNRELLIGWYLILLCGSSAGLPINLDVENSLIRLRSARNELIEDRLSAAMQAAENRSDGTTSTNFDCRVPVFISGLKRSFLCDLEELGLTAALLLRA